MFRSVRQKMIAAGGIASAADLHAYGMEDMEIRIDVMYGVLRRVRRGWYALPGTRPYAVEACRLGGRLACVSALWLYGHDIDDDGRIHIEVPANAVRRADAKDVTQVRLHWARHPSRGDRAAVSENDALRQAEACRSTWT